MKDFCPEIVLEPAKIEGKIDAIDQLDNTIIIMRGVSDALQMLAQQNHDYQEMASLLSDVVFQQYETLKQIDIVIKEELGL